MEFTWTNAKGDIRLWMLTLLLISGVASSNIQNIYKSNCSKQQIVLECPDFHKIAIKRLFYGTKNDQRCSGPSRTNSPDCCQPTHNDCLVVDDTMYPFLNMHCSGLRGCDIAAGSISAGRTCRDKGYRNDTDYMSVIYDCIPDEDVLTICSNEQKRGKLLYIANENYPNRITGGSRQCQCLIKTKHHVGIDIHALDVIITRADVGNHCYQDIELRDDDGHRKEITCGHPGLYAFRNIYNHDVRSVTLTLNSRAPTSRGYLWLQAKAKEDSDIIEVYCGDAMRRYLGYPVDDSESRTLDTNIPDVKVPPVDDVDTGPRANASTNANTKVMSDMVALIVGVSVAMGMITMIGLIGIIILCVRRVRAKRRPVRQEPPHFPSPILKTKQGNHTSNTYCHYDYDEDKYCSIKRSPMRMTKFTELNYTTPDRKLREAFSQGVASSESLDAATEEENTMPCYMNHMATLNTRQNAPLIENQATTESSEASEEDELIMPKSEYIAIGKAIQPHSMAREITNASLPPQKKKSKNKTVTFSPVAMVTPLPSGSEESVPEDVYLDDPKVNYLEMYSKTMPSRSPDRVKKVIPVQGTQDDMCLTGYPLTGCENVTEEDLWKAFHITLNDNLVPSKTMLKSIVPPPPTQVIQTKVPDEPEDPDYDENPYDNVPYINIGTLRRHNTPENTATDLYKEIMRRNRGEPLMETIPETC